MLYGTREGTAGDAPTGCTIQFYTWSPVPTQAYTKEKVRFLLSDRDFPHCW